MSQNLLSPASNWANVLGTPFVQVTPNGPNDGGNYGPNTVGTTTAGIQEAINSIPTGGTIFIKAGDYPITSQISIKYNSISIIGSGARPYKDSTNGTRIYASASFPLSTDMITVPDGVNGLKLKQLQIDMNSRANSSAVRLVTGVSGTGHTDCSLEDVTIPANGTGFIIQIDALDFSHWGRVEIWNYTNGIQWQALNASVNGFPGNNTIDFLYLHQPASGVANGVIFQNAGLNVIGAIFADGFAGTQGNGAVFDNCENFTVGILDAESWQYPLTIDATVTNAYSTMIHILNGVLNGVNGILLANQVVDCLFDNFDIFNGNATHTGVAIKDTSVKTGTLSVTGGDNLNIVSGGYVQTGVFANVSTSTNNNVLLQNLGNTKTYSAVLMAQTAAAASIISVKPDVTTSFDAGAWLDLLTLSGGTSPSIQTTVSWTDENSATHQFNILMDKGDGTITINPAATGFWSGLDRRIRVKGGTTATMETLVNGAPASLSYNVGVSMIPVPGS